MTRYVKMAKPKVGEVWREVGRLRRVAIMHVPWRPDEVHYFNMDTMQGGCMERERFAKRFVRTRRKLKTRRRVSISVEYP